MVYLSISHSPSVKRLHAYSTTRHHFQHNAALIGENCTVACGHICRNHRSHTSTRAMGVWTPKSPKNQGGPTSPTTQGHKHKSPACLDPKEPTVGGPREIPTRTYRRAKGIPTTHGHKHKPHDHTRSQALGVCSPKGPTSPTTGPWEQPHHQGHSCLQQQQQQQLRWLWGPISRHARLCPLVLPGRRIRHRHFHKNTSSRATVPLAGPAAWPIWGCSGWRVEMEVEVEEVVVVMRGPSGGTHLK